MDTGLGKQGARGNTGEDLCGVLARKTGEGTCGVREDESNLDHDDSNVLEEGVACIGCAVNQDEVFVLADSTGVCGSAADVTLLAGGRGGVGETRQRGDGGI